ncbi:MAG: serine/threonine-protein kinase, partial [Pseudomonadota bacterium]
MRDPELSEGDWARVDDLFDAATRMPPEDVDAYLADACADRPALAAFVHELVSSARVGDATLRDSVADLARDLASDPVLTGTRIGAYQCEALLGRGGMGEVYRAARADGQFTKHVAIKVIRSSANAQRVVQLFGNERQVMADLNHPSIPALVDAGQLDDGRPYFICDYIDGQPIDEAVLRTQMPLIDRVRLMERVAEALQHAHANLVLHLDIKPDNVLVQDDGTPVLLDFGIAQLMHESRAPVAFSVNYASPEQLRRERATTASDVYALGVLLYEVLSGKRAFSTPKYAPHETVLEAQADFTRRAEDSGGLDALPRDLKAIVRKAMAPAPDNRYNSANALADDLKRYRRRLPVTARSGSLAYRAWRYVQRHPWAVAATLAAFGALVGFGLREFDLRKQAQSAEAAATAAREVAAREARSARLTADFLTDIFKVAEPGAATAGSVTARDLLDNAEASIGANLTEQPLIRAQLMRTMAEAYLNLGSFDSAA